MSPQSVITDHLGHLVVPLMPSVTAVVDVTTGLRKEKFQLEVSGNFASN